MDSNAIVIGMVCVAGLIEIFSDPSGSLYWVSLTTFLGTKPVEMHAKKTRMQPSSASSGTRCSCSIPPFVHYAAGLMLLPTDRSQIYVEPGVHPDPRATFKAAYPTSSDPTKRP